MTKEELLSLRISEISKDAYNEARYQWDHIMKPLDGLGDFEEIICRIAAIQRQVCPKFVKRELVVFCADNGIVARNVTQSSQDVTMTVACALGKNNSSACLLAKSANVQVIPVDIGINCVEHIPGVLNKKVSYGTHDFLDEPAMSEGQMLEAIEVGIELVRERKKVGVDLIATGEMGIGNTTTSAAVLAALTGIDSDSLVGRGAGLDDERLINKRKVVRAGIEKYQNVYGSITDTRKRALEILRCLGGLDIAAMCGVFIGGAKYSVPIVIDGFISAVSALLAQSIVDGVNEYMIPSHSGREIGIMKALDILKLKPFINGNMALGEGTGALMVIPLLDMMLDFYRDGSRFDDASMAAYQRFD